MHATMYVVTRTIEISGLFVFAYIQAKQEMLDSVKQLEQMGFQLFASLGTADFYSDNGVKVYCSMYKTVSISSCC